MIELLVIARVWNLFKGANEYKRLHIKAPYLDGDTLRGIDDRGNHCGVYVTNVIHVQPAARCRRNTDHWDYIAVLDGSGREETRL